MLNSNAIRNSKFLIRNYMKYYISLFQKLKNLYKNQSSNPNEVALICPSLRVYEEVEMKMLLPDLLLDATTKGEALLKKEDISYQLNSLPTSDKYWDINIDKNLFEVFENLVNATQKTNISTDAFDPNVQKTLIDDKGKPSKAKKAYDKYVKLWEKMVEDWENHLQEYTSLTTDDEKTIWTEKMNLLHTKKSNLFADFKILGFKDTIENAVAIINQSNDYDLFLKELDAVKSALQNAKKTGLQSLATYLDMQFIPYDFMTGDNGWNTLSLDKTQLDQLYNEVKTNANHDFPEEIMSIDYDEKNITGIELEYAIVSIKRNWFNATPLISEYYTPENNVKISDGNTISNDFLLPAFPKKMMLIRNLKINIDDTITSNQVSDLNQIIRFGPIVMKNQLFVNEHNKAKFIKPIRNKRTLQSENVRVYNKKNLVHRDLQNPTTTTSARIVTSAPVATTIVQPMRSAVISRAVLTEKPLVIQPVLFNPIKILPHLNNLTLVNFSVKDKLSQEMIYKAEISITGINNAVFKEIETDQDGKISTQLPIGNYNIEIQKNGYGLLKNTLQIVDKNILTKDYILQPESVSYNSYFLVGMICERLPKIPV